MKLFIYEYFASGAEDHPELKQAGFAMLNAVLTDFSLLPDLQITTLLDYSLEDAVSRALYKKHLEIEWKKAKNDEFEQYHQILKRCDAILIIAPETAGILAKLTAMAELLDKVVLGSCSNTLELLCNKASVQSMLKKKGLPVPKSEVIKKPLTINSKADILKKFSLPLVIKPVYGTGGEGVRLVENEEQLDNVLHQLSHLKEDLFLVQEYVSGQPVSVSLFVQDGKVQPLSLNKQIINQENELVFLGVTVPYEHPRAQDIIKTASSACEQVEGLKGFVGVDLVVNSRGPVLIEINSRITLAYVALREVVSRNLAKDLLLLCQEQRFPDQPRYSGTFTYWL